MRMKRWTVKEIAYLQDNYPTMSAQEIKDRFLHRGLGSIYDAARRYNVMKEKKPNKKVNTTTRKHKDWLKIANEHKPRIVLASSVIYERS